MIGQVLLCFLFRDQTVLEAITVFSTRTSDSLDVLSIPEAMKPAIKFNILSHKRHWDLCSSQSSGPNSLLAFVNTKYMNSTGCGALIFFPWKIALQGFIHGENAAFTR